MGDYLLAIAVIFGVNLMPAFGPPTWSILVLFNLNFDLEPYLLVPLGALAAASGRFTLASGARRLRPRFPRRYLENLDAAEQALTASNTRAYAGLGLFALSPVPSAQLFVGAGLLTVRLLPLTLAFFSGRLVSYSIYVGASSVAKDNLGEIVGDSLTSPLGIALQLVMLAGLVLLVRLDWARILGRGRDRPTQPPAPVS